MTRVPIGLLVLLFFSGLFIGRYIEYQATLEPTTTLTHPFIPACAEDEIVTGSGDFHKGFWDIYECTHPDRFRSDAIGQAFPEFLESAEGRKAMARFLCEPYNQKAWYFDVEPTACNH